MSQQAAMSFAERMLTDEAFQRGAAAAVEGRSGPDATDALVRYAAGLGLDVTATELGAVRDAMIANAELSDESLAGVAGGMTLSPKDLSKIEQMESDLAAVGEDAQLANVDLQQVLQRQQQALQQMSNMSKMLHDTAMSVIRKIGG